MKHFIIVLSLISLISCKKQEAEKVNIEFKENDEIEVYNFEQLENFLQTEQDQIYVVNFWATWCKPCIKELPYFENLHVKYKSDVKVVLVSLDFPSKLESQLIPFINKKGIQSQVVLLDDPYENEWIPKVDSTWSGAIPATLIFNRTERKFFEQSFTQEELENEIIKFKTL